MPHPSERPNNFDSPETEDSFYPKPPKDWVEVLKLYLRDIAENNILLNQEAESRPEMLELAWGIALMDWNESSPRLRSVGFHDHPFRTGLLYKAAIETIRSVSIAMMRNELDYQDGDERYAINSQYRAMMQWANQLDEEYKQGKQRIKTELNSSLAWGGCSSEFGLIFPNLSRSAVTMD